MAQLSPMGDDVHPGHLALDKALSPIAEQPVSSPATPATCRHPPLRNSLDRWPSHKSLFLDSIHPDAHGGTMPIVRTATLTPYILVLTEAACPVYELKPAQEAGRWRCGEHRGGAFADAREQPVHVSSPPSHGPRAVACCPLCVVRPVAVPHHHNKSP